MSSLITLTCPSCGGRLEVTNQAERYVCVHCGNAHVIDPGVRAESLAKEVEQMRLKMDIRQMEEDLLALCKRQAEIKTVLTGYERDQRAIKVALLTLLPLGVVALFAFLALQLDTTTLLLLLMLSLVLAVIWIISSHNRYQAEQSEAAHLKKRIASGQQTLNFLQQELKRVSNSQQPSASN